MRERIEELEAEDDGTAGGAVRLDTRRPSGPLKKSYELAAKYMPAGQGGTAQQPTATEAKEDEKTVRNGKAVAQPVGQITERIVRRAPHSL